MDPGSITRGSWFQRENLTPNTLTIWILNSKTIILHSRWKILNSLNSSLFILYRIHVTTLFCYTPQVLPSFHSQFGHSVFECSLLSLLHLSWYTSLPFLFLLSFLVAGLLGAQSFHFFAVRLLTVWCKTRTYDKSYIKYRDLLVQVVAVWESNIST